MNKSETELNAIGYLTDLGYTCIPPNAKFTPANVKVLAKQLLVLAEQAEQDSALTWEDVKLICELYGNLNDTDCGDCMGSQKYYETLLNKFNELKQKRNDTAGTYR